MKRPALIAALAVSAGAHAAAAIVAMTGAPAGRAIEPSSRFAVRLVAPAPAATAPPPMPMPMPMPSVETALATAPKPATAHALRDAVPLPSPEPAVADDAVDTGPRPLTYPVLPLPADDDPHRVGMVRLLLVVSSEGTVVDRVVTATTLPDDDVDRIANGFAAMRFAPATRHGFPHAAWYEVVVDLAFDPPRGAA